MTRLRPGFELVSRPPSCGAVSFARTSRDAFRCNCRSTNQSARRGAARRLDYGYAKVARRTPPEDAVGAARRRPQAEGRLHLREDRADSGRVPFVAVMESADVGARHDPTNASRVDCARLGRVLGQCEVRSGAVVVREVGPKDPPQMSLVDDDDVVQTRAPDRPDDALDVGILPGRLWSGADGAQAQRVDGSVERRIEGRVPGRGGGTARSSRSGGLRGVAECAVDRH